MLTSISVEIVSNEYRGGIEIHSSAEIQELSNIDTIEISRKIYNTNSWSTVYTKEISSVSDLNFNLFDITTASGKVYSYGISLKNGFSTVESDIFEPIESTVEGMFIGNFEKQYVAQTNHNVDVKRNNEVDYVTTLGSKYPFRISNGNINYSTGSANGLFLRLDENNMLVPDYDHSYQQEVVDFLTDGSGKVLKTYEGQMWYISIDDTVSSPYNEGFLGKNEIQFNWTEIGDVPKFGMVVD